MAGRYPRYLVIRNDPRPSERPFLVLLPLGLALLAGGAASTWFDGPQALSGPLLVFGGAAFGGALADPRADWRMWRNPAGEEPMERKVRRMRLLACYLSGALSGAAMWWGLAG